MTTDMTNYKTSELAQSVDVDDYAVRDEWHTWGIVEIAIRNPNVASYIAEWEDRALVAERALLIKAKRDRLPVDVITPEKRVQRWLEDARESMKPIDAEEQQKWQTLSKPRGGCGKVIRFGVNSTLNGGGARRGNHPV